MLSVEARLRLRNSFGDIWDSQSGRANADCVSVVADAAEAAAQVVTEAEALARASRRRVQRHQRRRTASASAAHGRLCHLHRACVATSSRSALVDLAQVRFQDPAPRRHPHPSHVAAYARSNTTASEMILSRARVHGRRYSIGATKRHSADMGVRVARLSSFANPLRKTATTAATSRRGGCRAVRRLRGAARVARWSGSSDHVIA